MCICNAAEPGKTRSSMSSPPQHCRRCHHHCRSHCRRRNTPQPLCVSTLHRLPATSPTATTSDPSEYPSPPSLPLPPFYLASILAPATLPCHASDVIHMRAEPAELHFVSSQSSVSSCPTIIQSDARERVERETDREKVTQRQETRETERRKPYKSVHSPTALSKTAAGSVQAIPPAG